MKNSKSVVAVVLAMLFLIPMSVSARSYFGLSVGGSSLDNYVYNDSDWMYSYNYGDNVNVDYSAELVTDTAIVFDMSLGFFLGDNVALETELSYQQNDIGRMKIRASATDIDNPSMSVVVSDSIKLHDEAFKTFSIMENVYYNINTGMPLTPYVGVGIGGSIMTMQDEVINEYFFDNLSFTYQFIVGASYAFNDSVSLDLKYKAVFIPDVDIHSYTKYDYQAATTIIGVKFMF